MDAQEILAVRGSSGREDLVKARRDLQAWQYPQSNSILSRKAKKAAEALERVVFLAVLSEICLVRQDHWKRTPPFPSEIRFLFEGMLADKEVERNEGIYGINKL